MPSYLVKTSVDISTEFWNGRKIARLSDGRLCCSYTYLNAATARDEVHCSFSIDEGVTWTIEEIVAADPGAHLRASSLAVDSAGNLHIVYSYVMNFGPLPHFFRVYYRMRTAAGWQPEELVSDLGDGNVAGSDPAIAIDSQNNIHVVYESTHPLFPLCQNAKYRKKTSGGWQAAEWITATNGGGFWGQYFVAVAIDSIDNVHVAWEGTGWGLNPGFYNIQYRRRTGAGWGVQEALTDLGISQWHPSIAVDSSDNVHVAWAYGGNYRQRTGAGWGPVEIIGFTAPSDLNLSLDQFDTPYVVAENIPGLTTQLYYSRRVAGIWSPQVDIGATPFDNYAPILIWARWPTISGLKTNIPLTGGAVLFWVDTAPREVRYAPFVLSWPAPPSPPLQRNKAYALAREEL